MHRICFLLALLSSILFFGSAWGRFQNEPQFQFPEERFAIFDDGQRIGYEIEFWNLPIEKAVKISNVYLQGQIEKREHWEKIVLRHPTTQKIQSKKILLYHYYIKNSLIGDVLIKPEDNATSLHEDELSRKKQILEMVTRPITADKAHHLQQATTALQLAGAKGTEPGFAVSIQLNLEVGGGVKQQINPQEVVQLLRLYYWPTTQLARSKTLNILPERQSYVRPISPGFWRRLSDPSYFPSQRDLFDDAIYRQMHELAGLELSWSLPIERVKKEVLAQVRAEYDNDQQMGEYFFRVIKFSPIKVASLLIFLFPNDPISKIILKTGWIHAIPAVEFRERNNDFNIFEATRHYLGYFNKAKLSLKALAPNCADLL